MALLRFLTALFPIHPMAVSALFTSSARSSFLAITTFFLTGCGTLPPPSGTIAGVDAARAVVVVKKTQTMRMRDGRNIELRAGTYASVEEDEDGLYFESPIGIAIDDHFFGARMAFKQRPGGIYLEREELNVPRIYFRLTDVRGSELERLRAKRPYVFELKEPEKLEFTLGPVAGEPSARH